jgi:hypothetical protein
MIQNTPLAYSAQAQSIRIGGRYEHYKGMPYRVIAVARHSETLEELVVYQALYGDGGLWVRPLSMFTENVVIDGQEQPRFRFSG